MYRAEAVASAVIAPEENTSVQNAAGGRPHIAAILLLSLLARLLVISIVATQYPAGWLFSRGIELGALAQSLLSGKGFSSPFGGSTGPTALLSPGYPAVIAGMFAIFGSYSRVAAIATMLLQLLFSVLTVFLIMYLAWRQFGARQANVAGIFWALSLPLIWMPTIFWETCLSSLLLIGMVAFVLLSREQAGALYWCLLGAYCGISGLVNPALLPALLALFCWDGVQKRKMRRWLPLLGLLMVAVVYAAWPIRNAKVLHAFIPMRSTVGLELWMGNHPGADGYLDEVHFPLFDQQEMAAYVKKGEVAYMREKAAAAKAYIRAYPGQFAQLTARRVIRFWSGTGNRKGSVIFALHASLTTCLGLIGLWRLFRKGQTALAILFLLPLALFPMPYYITHAEFRYRLVLDPLLTVLGSYGVLQRATVPVRGRPGD